MIGFAEPDPRGTINNLHSGIPIVRFLLVFAVLSACAFSVRAQQWQFQGQQHTEYAVDRQKDSIYFESWTHFSASYDAWRIGLRYEIHDPPQPFSAQKRESRIAQSFVEYRKNGLTITAGNFYGILGRGIVLRSYESRPLRWDTNIQGMKFDYKSKTFDVLWMGGQPRDLTGKRYESLQAGELRVKPTKSWQVGGTGLVTDVPGGRMYVGSGLTQYHHKNFNVYAEVARKEHPINDLNGWAYYASGNVYVGDLSLSAEYKEYDQFNLSEGVTFNNPPTSVREHLYTLLNRHQLVQDANDERGYLVEATYPVLEDAVLTLEHSRIRNHDGRRLYEEVYGQWEWDFPESWQWIGAAGWQEDLEARYLNLVGSSSWKFTETKSAKLLVEHQHAKIHATDRMFVSQVVTAGYSESGKYTLSVIGEHTTDHFSEKKNWIGLQADVHFWEKFDATVFAGSRREGKICAGGVCVQKPEFKGVEITFIARL